MACFNPFYIPEFVASLQAKKSFPEEPKVSKSGSSRIVEKCICQICTCGHHKCKHRRKSKFLHNQLDKDNLLNDDSQVSKDLQRIHLVTKDDNPESRVQKTSSPEATIPDPLSLPSFKDKETCSTIESDLIKKEDIISEASKLEKEIQTSRLKNLLESCNDEVVNFAEKRSVNKTFGTGRSRSESEVFVTKTFKLSESHTTKSSTPQESESLERTLTFILTTSFNEKRLTSNNPDDFVIDNCRPGGVSDQQIQERKDSQELDGPEVRIALTRQESLKSGDVFEDLDGCLVDKRKCEQIIHRKKMMQEYPEKWRASSMKREDNLQPRGSFETRQLPNWTPSDKVVVRKHEDNLYSQRYNPGDWNRSSPTKSGLSGSLRDLSVARGKTTFSSRRADNLKPGGNFTNKVEKPWQPADKPTVVRHEDNLTIGQGGLDAVRKVWATSGKRTSSARLPDNLNSLGSFGGHHQEKGFIEARRNQAMKGDRAPVVIHKDNLGVGESFGHRRPKSRSDDYYQTIPLQGKRCIRMKPKDNLFPQGSFEQRPAQPAICRGESSGIVLHPDNLTMEGGFEHPRRKSDPQVTTRRKVPSGRHPDNLKLEGTFYGSRTATMVPKGDRAPIVRREDNLKMEGSMEFESTSMSAGKAINRVIFPRSKSPYGLSTSNLTPKRVQDSWAEHQQESSLPTPNGPCPASKLYSSTSPFSYNRQSFSGHQIFQQPIN